MQRFPNERGNSRPYKAVYDTAILQPPLGSSALIDTQQVTLVTIVIMFTDEKQDLTLISILVVIGGRAAQFFTAAMPQARLQVTHSKYYFNVQKY